MAYTDVYLQRVGMQDHLDQVFPDGAWVQTLLLTGPAIGPEMSVGRLFCADAQLRNGVWSYEILMEERHEEPPDEQGYAKPYRVWIDSIEEGEGLLDEVYDCLITFPEDAVVSGLVLRLNGAPEGDRKPLEGARDFQTEKWEQILFPYGVEELEG